MNTGRRGERLAALYLFFHGCRILERNYRFGRATHGYLPEKGPQPTLIAFGPHMKPGVVLKNANLVDEAPTFAHALGFEMENTDGRCLTELFRD